MALIDKETIRKEIDRRINYYSLGRTTNLFRPIVQELNSVLAFLDTLPEQQPVEVHIDNPNIEKIDPNIKVEIRTDGTGDIDGKEMLYVANKSYKIGFRDGKAGKEQPMEGLEDEYVRFVRTDHHIYQDLIGNGGIDLARHFAEWGAKQVKSND